MNIEDQHTTLLPLALADAWARLERRIDGRLGAIRGISFAEYRLLNALADAPRAQATRVELARRVSLTPSGVTRALRPMEKLGVVSTAKSKRDARLAIAALTPAGREILEDAAAIVREILQEVLADAPSVDARRDELLELLLQLAAAAR